MLADWPGFSIIENVITDAECVRLLDALSAADGRAGVRNLMANDEVSALARDARLTAIAERILEQPVIPYKATLFSKTGRANWLVAWHQDTALPVEGFREAPGWGPASAKDGVTFAHAPTSALSKVVALRIHLDQSTERNGPLRVIPDSHHRRLTAEEIDAIVSDREPKMCTVDRGGVIAMSPLLVHASSKCVDGNQPRRVLHIEYATSLELGNEIRLAIA